MYGSYVNYAIKDVIKSQNSDLFIQWRYPTNKIRGQFRCSGLFDWSVGIMLLKPNAATKTQFVSDGRMLISNVSRGTLSRICHTLLKVDLNFISFNVTSANSTWASRGWICCKLLVKIDESFIIDEKYHKNYYWKEVIRLQLNSYTDLLNFTFPTHSIGCDTFVTFFTVKCELFCSYSKTENLHFD